MASGPTSPAGDRRWLSAALLFGLVALAAALRFWGIRWGLPNDTHLFSYHPDEIHSLWAALSLAAGDPNPHFFNYGSLYLYLVAIACLWHDSVLGQADLVSALLKGGTAHTEMAAWVLDGRLVTVLCGVATVAIVFLAGRRLFGLWGGVAAGAMLAVAPLHVLHSHYATVDVPLALFVAMCVYLSIGLEQRRTWRACALAGACAGLAAGVKYNGALVLLAPVVTCLLPRDEGSGGRRAADGGGLESPPHRGNNRQAADGRRRTEDGLRIAAVEQGARATGRLASVATVLVACALTFAITSPYVLLSFPEAWQGISYELGHMRAGEPPAAEAYGSGWLFHLHPAVLLVPLAALLWTGRPRATMLGPAILTLLWYAAIAAAKVRYARYEMPLEPLGAVGFGGVLAWALQAKAKALKPLAVSLAAAWCLLMAGACVQRNTVLHGIDVRAEMLRQMERQVPEDQTVALAWEPWFNVAPVDYCNGGQVLRGRMPFSRFARPVRPIEVTGLSVDKLRQTRPHAVLVSDFELDPLYDRVSEEHREFRRYLQQSGEYKLAAREGAAFANDRVWGASGPDNRYAHPWLELYVRSEH